MSLLSNLKSSKSKSSSKTSYTLPEIVGIMYLIGEGKTKQELVEITGRTAHTLQYKFYEGTVNMTQKDGTVKTSIRSVRKYESMEELFKDHGKVFTQELQDKYIEEYLRSLQVVEQAS